MTTKSEIQALSEAVDLLMVTISRQHAVMCWVMHSKLLLGLNWVQWALPETLHVPGLLLPTSFLIQPYILLKAGSALSSGDSTTSQGNLCHFLASWGNSPSCNPAWASLVSTTASSLFPPTAPHCEEDGSVFPGTPLQDWAGCCRVPQSSLSSRPSKPCSISIFSQCLYSSAELRPFCCRPMLTRKAWSDGWRAGGAPKALSDYAVPFWVALCEQAPKGWDVGNAQPHSTYTVAKIHIEMVSVHSSQVTYLECVYVWVEFRTSHWDVWATLHFPKHPVLQTGVWRDHPFNRALSGTRSLPSAVLQIQKTPPTVHFKAEKKLQTEDFGEESVSWGSTVSGEWGDGVWVTCMKVVQGRAEQTARSY